MTRILQVRLRKFNPPNPSYASPFLHKEMYLPLIKLSLVFEFFSKLGFVKGTEDELERKLLQNFMSLFTRHEPRGRRGSCLVILMAQKSH